ncbi:MAG: YerC/YecD family TrpR-related protein [Oscillospiraceae bacterium]|nr:YerC/YecD family TrpR-related protein [Oscillospiraceae bacterium]
MNTPKYKTAETDELFDAFLSLKTLDECYIFFEDIMTTQEIKALAQRLQIAKRLHYNNDTYATISDECGASVATTSRVKNCIMYGPGGYKLVLDRLRGASESE